MSILSPPAHRPPPALPAAGRREAFPAPAETPRVKPVFATTAAALPLPPSADPGLRTIRRLVWLYLILWVIEGALRKWVVPGLANPLLIIRDPVLLGIYALALQRRVFPFRHPFVVLIGALGALCVLVAYLVTPASWVVITYGWRSNFLHLPLIFVIPLVFDESDVRKVGRWLLLSALPMSVLVLLQFRGAPTAWVNTVVGGEGKQLESAFDHVRVAGTFSFTNGMCAYTALVAAFFFYQMLERKAFARWLWFCSGGALVIMVTLSGSRATVGVVLLVVLGVALTCVVRPVYWRASFKLFAVGGLVMLVLGSFAVFREGLNVFSYRFGDEQSIQKGFFLRYFGSLMVSPIVWTVAPYGGIGLGMGTNVASSLLIGKRYFMAAEGEYDRLVLESGPVLGVMCILLRQSIVVWLGVNALRRLRTEARPLPMLLLFAGMNSLLIGQWAQPTELGYSVIAGGLCLAAMRRAPDPEAESEQPDNAAPAENGATPPPGRKPNAANGIRPDPLRSRSASRAARAPRRRRPRRRSQPRRLRRRGRRLFCDGDGPPTPNGCTAAPGGARLLRLPRSRVDAAAVIRPRRPAGNRSVCPSQPPCYVATSARFARRQLCARPAAKHAALRRAAAPRAGRARAAGGNDRARRRARPPGWRDGFRTRQMAGVSRQVCALPAPVARPGPGRARRGTRAAARGARVRPFQRGLRSRHPGGNPGRC